MRPKVLVIDDEEGFTKILKMNLERNDAYEVHVENNSMNALAVARDFRPDVILLDIVMPGLDGGDIAAQFADHPYLRRVPVIMLTALVAQDETNPEAVVQAGAMNVLPKPVNMDLLTRCINNALQKSDSARA